MYLRAKNTPGREEREIRSEKQQRRCQGQKRRSSSSSRAENKSTLRPMEDHTPEQRTISWRNCVPWRTHTGADFSQRTATHGEDLCWNREKVWGGRSGRDWVFWTHCNPPIPHPTLLGPSKQWVEGPTVREWSWAWAMAGKAVLVFGFSFPVNLIYFRSATNWFSPSQENSAMTRTHKQSPCLFTHELSHPIFFP